MNKFTLLCSALAACITFSASAQVNQTPDENALFGNKKEVKRYRAILHDPSDPSKILEPVKKAKSQKAEGEESTTVILHEGFDKFTGGSEEEPDLNTNILDMNGNILSKYTELSGWSGVEVYMAGGNCYIGYDYNYYSGGSLTTPKMNLTRDNGKFTIKLRAKSPDKSDLAWIEFDHSTTGDFWGQYDMKTQKIATDWTEYTVEFEGGSTTSVIMFYLTAGSQVLIDYIEITQTGDELPSPVATAPTNITPVSFTATWEPVAGAESYKLNIWHKIIDKDNTVVETQVEDFSGLKVVDGNFVELGNNDWGETCLAQGLKDGWKANIGLYGSYKHYFKDENMVLSAPYSLCFDENFDNLYTPENTEKDMSYFSFNVKSEELLPNYDRISILVKYTNGGEQPWDVYAILFLADYPEVTNEFIEIYMDEEYMPAGVCQIMLQFNGASADPAGVCAIDDVTVSFGKDVPTLPEYVVENLEVKDTQYSIDNLIEGDTYYYSVRAVDAEGNESPESNVMTVPLTFTSLDIPEVKPATDIKEGQFTANWSRVAYAQGYAVYVSLTHEAQEDEIYVIDHETFDAIPSLAEPGNPDFSDNTLLYLSDYCNRAGWSAFYPVFAESMVGTTYGLNSPVYQLYNNDGQYTVDVKVYGAVGDTITLIANDDENSVQLREQMIMEENLMDFSFEFDNGSHRNGLTFITSGEYMLLDEITIKQAFSKGDQTTLDYVNGVVNGGDVTSAIISTLGAVKGDSYMYRVKSWGYDSSNNLIQSGFSNYEYVEPVVGINSTVADDNTATVYVIGDEVYVELAEDAVIDMYDVQGVKVATLEGVQGLNKMRLNGNGMYIVKVGNKAYKVIK